MPRGSGLAGRLLATVEGPGRLVSLPYNVTFAVVRTAFSLISELPTILNCHFRLFARCRSAQKRCKVFHRTDALGV
jgi:hypothetical protein